MAKLEIACFNVQSAIIAEGNGADRVELCANMKVGGTTPSVDDIKLVREKVSIDLNVMIRPRGGSFVYSEPEFQNMREAIQDIKKIGVDGFVFGILTADNKVDIAKNKELISIASPLPCTFHRAFDEVESFEEELENLIECGFSAVLTSGCEPNVDKGESNLRRLVELAHGRIVIMPGGGLRSTNLERVLRETNAVYFHSSAITDGTETAVAEEVKALAQKLI